LAGEAGEYKMSIKRRVVITGIGVISPIGIGKESFWNNLINGVSGIKRITRFDPTPFRSQIAGEVNDFNPTKFMDPQQARRMDRFAQFAVAATNLALQDARVDNGWLATASVGDIIGTAVAGFSFAEEEHDTFRKRGARHISPFLAAAVFPTAAPGQVSINLKIHGPSYAVSAGCASGSIAIGHALNLIRAGTIDMAIAGGADAPITPLVFGSFDIIRSLSTQNYASGKSIKPFDKKRDGTVVSEGAGIVILEELNHALERGAHIYAEIIGFGNTSDGYHITQPLLSGKFAIEAIRIALKDAGIRGEDVDHINAHGSATEYNDAVETKIIKEVFGKKAYDIPINSIKSMIGHTQGAAGAIETIASALTLENNIIPPTINYENFDPDCDLDYVPNKAREKDVNIVVSNSFGFGGSNAILIFKKYSQKMQRKRWFMRLRNLKNIK